MDMTTTSASGDTRRYVSTGHLPDPGDVGAILAETHALHAHNTEGEVSQVYPALARVPRAVRHLHRRYQRQSLRGGDTDHPFSIMSVSKPFVFALVCQAIGWEAGPCEDRRQQHRAAVQLARRRRNERRRADEPDGECRRDRDDQPRSGRDRDARWRFIHDGLSRFAGRELPLNDEVYASASATNFRNRSIVQLLHSLGRVYCDPVEAVDLYTRQCSLNVSAQDLAVMGATLADGGVNPLTRERVVDASVCHYALAVMATAGLYETSGDWLYDIGLPGKSGIGGGIVTVSPGKGGLGSFRSAARCRRQQRQGAAGREIPVPTPGHGPVRLDPAD